MEETVKFMQLQINALQLELEIKNKRLAEAEKIIQQYVQTLEVIADEIN